MRKLSFSTIILSIVLLALSTISMLLLIPAVQISQQALDQELQLAHKKDAVILTHLFDQHFEGIARTAAAIVANPALIEDAEAGNLGDIRQLLLSSINSSAGDHIQAFAVQLHDGPVTLVPGAALFNVYIPLAELATSQILPDTWTPLTTKQRSIDYQLLRLSLPIISQQFGEVLGYLHSFVLLNDNFWLLNQIQSLTGADAVALAWQDQPLGALFESKAQRERLDVLQAGAITRTDSGLVHHHEVHLRQTGSYQIRLLIERQAPNLLLQHYRDRLGYAVFAVLVIGLVTMLSIYRLTRRPLRHLISYTEQIPFSPPNTGFPPGCFAEFNRVGSAVEAMVRRMREYEGLQSSLLRHTPSLFFIKDLERRYRLVNPVFEKTFGLEADQVIGKTSCDIFPAELAEQYRKTDQKVLDLGLVVVSEYSLETAQKGTCHFLSTKFPLLDENGKPCAIGGIITEIPQHRQAAEQLKLSHQILTNANAAQANPGRTGAVAGQLRKPGLLVTEPPAQCEKYDPENIR